MLERKWFTTKDVQSYTGLSPSTIQRAVKDGRLKTSKATGRNMFLVSWIDDFMETNR